MLLLTVGLSLACVDPARLNSTCTWSEPGARPLDLTKKGDRDHLREDARVAGEIEVRYADSTRTSPDQMEGLVEQCRATLYATITAQHGVTVADLTKAERARNWWVDSLLVFLPIGLLAWWATDRVVRKICRSFDSNGKMIAAGSVIVLVPVIAAIAVGIAQFWEFGIASSLLRNGHVSFRAFYLPATMHGWIALFSAITLCTTAAVWRFSRTPLTGNVDAYKPALSIRRAR